ncbi:MAG: hypothetical protein Q9214_002097 [Letrouitia sp. 1 TL-2023]
MAKSSGQATNTAAPSEDKLGEGQPETGDSKSTFKKLKEDAERKVGGKDKPKQ